MIDYKTLDERLTNSSSILITASQNINEDILLSASALFEIINSHYEKFSTLALSEILSSDQQRLLSDLNFDIQNISNHIEGLKYIIQIPKNDDNKVVSVTYDEDDSNFYFHITPGNADFDVDNITVMKDEPEFDLILILGADNTENIGTVYTENEALFTEDKVIYINNSEGSIIDEIYKFIKSQSIDYGENISQILLNGILLSQYKSKFDDADKDTFLDIADIVGKNASYQTAFKFVESVLKKEEKPSVDSESSVSNRFNRDNLFSRTGSSAGRGMNFKSSFLQQNKETENKNRFNPAGT